MYASKLFSNRYDQLEIMTHNFIAFSVPQFICGEIVCLYEICVVMFVPTVASLDIF